MGSNKINRTGEIGINNFGSEMVIIRYRTNKDMDVYFPKYNWTFKNARYNDFKNGSIKCPYERRVYRVGYLGEGKYNAKVNNKSTKCYVTWYDMLRRCYDEKYHKGKPTYIGCRVCDEWLCYQNFAEWYYNNYYEINNEIMHLDKDILHKGNKIYSPENCVFVPNNINILFTKNDKVRGDCPIGVTYHKKNKKFVASCSVYNLEENKKKQIYLGCYNTSKKAFEIYKEFKENHIKEIADEYEDFIPQKLYDALYQYQVDVTD